MIDKYNYKDYVEKHSPKSPIVTNCIKAFFVGGLICVIGQGIAEISIMYGVSKENSAIVTAMVLIFLGALLTGLGIYDKLGKFAGGGSLIPISGFANSIVSSAMEFKKEGYIMGVGAKMFTVAGPVIVFGIITSITYGLIFWLINFVL